MESQLVCDVQFSNPSRCRLTSPGTEAWMMLIKLSKFEKRLPLLFFLLNILGRQMVTGNVKAFPRSTRGWDISVYVSRVLIISPTITTSDNKSRFTTTCKANFRLDH